MVAHLQVGLADRQAENKRLDQQKNVLLATGVTPRNPKIPGQDEQQKTGKVLSYIDVLRAFALSLGATSFSADPGTLMPQFFPDGNSVRPALGDGSASRQIEAIWHLPANLPAGRYRVRYSGTAVPSPDQPDAGTRTEFEGSSAVFAVDGPTDDCPGYPAMF